MQILGDAVDLLFRDLPTQHQRAFPDLLTLVGRLEKHADALRRKRDEIEVALSEAGGAGRRSLAAQNEIDARLSARAAAAITSLEKSRAHVVGRLSTVLAALETLRLDLIQLRAGAGTPIDLTSDLEAARAISADVERLLAGHAEAERIAAGQ